MGWAFLKKTYFTLTFSVIAFQLCVKEFVALSE